MLEAVGELVEEELWLTCFSFLVYTDVYFVLPSVGPGARLSLLPQGHKATSRWTLRFSGPQACLDM